MLLNFLLYRRASGQNNNRYRQHLNSCLAAALKQLQLLRQLDLAASSFDDSGLSAISSLANLQDLRIDSLGRATAASFAALPTMLIRLELRQMKDVVLIGNAAADRLAALQQLRHLQLHDIGGVEVSALGGLTQLTHLHLQGLDKMVGQRALRLLNALSGMLQLQHLHLSAALSEGDVATGWAALTATTQLTYLCYDRPAWHYGKCCRSHVHCIACNSREAYSR
jgi:hypothetical protein